jgi:hypothetical protein
MLILFWLDILLLSQKKKTKKTVKAEQRLQLLMIE